MDISAGLNPENELLLNLHRLHTTELGAIRIIRNLGLDVNTGGVVGWCIEQTRKPGSQIYRQGKNWYVNIFSTEFCVITVNAYSYTIITAHKGTRRME